MRICKPCSARQRTIWIICIGNVLILIGILIIIGWPSLSNKIIYLNLPLSPLSRSYQKWHITPIPIYTSFYLYNWTNPHQVNDPRIKPHFEEMGPYVFREMRIKENEEWNNKESSVAYFDRRYWNFDATRSNGSLDDLITIPHFPTVAAAKISRRMPKFKRKVINFALNREGGGLTLTASALEWIFDGFYIDIFDFVQRLRSPLFPVHTNEFAWFYRRNNSMEVGSNFTIYTGKSDISQLATLKLWNGKSHSGLWEGICGRIHGSTGELWAPRKRWEEPVSLFINELARYINLYPQRNVSFRGINAWLYTSTNETFDSGYIAADTKCFCVRDRECPRNGLVDFSPVAYGAPFYISHPHFYMADAMYLENTTGLVPDPRKHGIEVLIEPTLGIPLKTNGQVLTSLLVEEDDSIDYLRNISHKFYAPILMVQTKADIDDDLLNFVKMILFVPRIGLYIGSALAAGGLLNLIVGVWMMKAQKRPMK